MSITVSKIALTEPSHLQYKSKIQTVNLLAFTIETGKLHKKIVRIGATNHCIHTQ